MIRRTIIPILVVLFEFLAATSLLGQQAKTLFTGFNLNYPVKAGDTAEVSITNHATTPVSFYPLTRNEDTLHAGRYLCKASLYSWIKEIPTAQKIERIKRVAEYLKSMSFENDYLITSDLDTNVQKKLYTIALFTFGLSQKQCGNYRYMAIKILIETGTFSPDSIMEVSLPHHQVAACIYLGDTVLLDFDPGEAFFLNRGPNGKFLSPSEVYTYRNSLTDIYKDCHELVFNDSCMELVYGGDNLVGPDSLQNLLLLRNTYYTLFDSGITYYPSPKVIIPDDSAKITLPPGFSMKFSWNSVANELSWSQYDSAMAFYSANDTAGLYAYLTPLFGTDPRPLISSADVIIGDTSFNQITVGYSYEKFNTCEIYGVAQDTVWIGKDLSAPFYIHSVTTSKDMLLDTVVYSHDSVSTTWLLNEKGDVPDNGFAPGDVTSVPTLSSKQIHTLLSSGFIPAGDTVHLVLFYNERNLAVFGQGMRILPLGGATDSLVVQKYQNRYVDTIITTAIPQVSVMVPDIKLYPNPTTGRVTIISNDKISDFVVYNTLGQQVSVELQNINGKSTFSLQNCNSGIYFVKIGSEVQKVVLTK